MKKITKTKQVKSLDKPAKQVTKVVYLKGKGDNGYTPVKGVDYNDGINGVDGNDGHTPTKEELLSLILPNIPKPLRGVPGKSFTTEEVLSIVDDVLSDKMPEMIKELQSKGTVSIEEAKDGSNIIINGKKYFFPNAVYAPKLRNFIQMGDTPDSYVGQAGKVVKVRIDETGLEFGIGGGGSGVQSVIAGTGISVDNTDPDNPVISSTISQYTDFDAQHAVGDHFTPSDTITPIYIEGAPSFHWDVNDGSIDENKLSDSVNDSLDLADSAAQLTFKTIAVSGQSDIVADTATDTLTLVAGTNVTITTDASTDSITINASGGGGSGDVTGPASSTDNAIARFDGTTGKIIQNSGATISDAGNITANNFSGSSSGTNTGDQTITLTGDVTGSGTGSFTTAIATGVIVNADINASAAIGATKIANGSVSNAEFQRLSGVTSNIQTQIDGKQATGNYITALTGDVTASGPGSVAATLATVNSNVGTFGSSTSIPTFTVNGKGLITTASGNAVIAPAGTLTGTTLNSTVVTSSLTSLGTQAAQLNMGSNKIINVTDPTNAQDAATKAYVDNLSTGLSWKQAVRVATTTNGTLATAYENGDTIDGVVLATGNRILIKNQTTQTENGIYTVNASGAPTRATDADTGTELVSATVLVTSGTVNADTQWTCTNDSITIGSTNITFAQIAGAGTYTAGTGLTLTSNAFSVNTSQNISTLSNLTTNGLVTTSGGTGALSVTTLGTGVSTWLSTPSSANLASAVTDETGSGALVFANSPTLVTPALGTPTALVGTNITGTGTGFTSGDSQKINGISVTGTPSVGQVPVATSSSAATWQTVSGGYWDFAYQLTADFTVTNSATLADITGTSFATVAGETWYTRVTGTALGNNTAGDVRFNLHTTGTWSATTNSIFTGFWYDGTAVFTTTTGQGFFNTTDALQASSSAGMPINNGDNVRRPFNLEFYFTVSTNGNVTAQACNNSAGGGRTSTISKGTWILARKITTP